MAVPGIPKRLRCNIDNRPLWPTISCPIAFGPIIVSRIPAHESKIYKPRRFILRINKPDKRFVTIHTLLYEVLMNTCHAYIHHCGLYADLIDLKPTFPLITTYSRNVGSSQSNANILPRINLKGYTHEISCFPTMISHRLINNVVIFQIDAGRVLYFAFEYNFFF